MKKYLKKISQNAVSGFDFSGKCGILCTIGIGTPVSIAEAAAVKGGDLQKFYGDSFYFESAGRTLCGVTIDTCSNPAGSFFVPDLELRGKSREKLVDRRLEKCKTILRTANRTALFSPILTATTPPGVCPNSPQFRSTTPEPIL